MKIDIQKYCLAFRFEAGTSRGVMTSKETYFIKLYHPDVPGKVGLGECGPLKGLSPDLNGDLLGAMEWCTRTISSFEHDEVEKIIDIIPEDYPALRFGLETAMLDFNQGGRRILFENEFTRSKKTIPINGLVWMGDKDQMVQRLNSKIDEGYTCIKIKIGGIHFDEERALLTYIRKQYSSNEITIRLDANGAFSPKDVLKILEQLSVYDIHSIEQPINAGDWKSMEYVCDRSPIPVALDEELIGINGREQKLQLLDSIKPSYIILKPMVLGGFEHCREWISLAAERGIGWWVTSALESNIGLNAVAQFTANYALDLPQGLGTGQLYHNNLPSPLDIHRGFLQFDSNKRWDLKLLNGPYLEFS